MPVNRSIGIKPEIELFILLSHANISKLIVLKVCSDQLIEESSVSFQKTKRKVANGIFVVEIYRNF